MTKYLLAVIAFSLTWSCFVKPVDDPTLKAAFWWAVFYIVVAVLSTVATFMLMPEVPSQQDAKAAEFKDIQLPTADQDRVVPEIFGTVLIKPNLIWAGDFKAQKLQVKQESGGGGS